MGIENGVTPASKTNDSARMHPLLLLARHASPSQQTAKTYAWNQAQPPAGTECDELSTLSLRISRPFKRQRKGSERELEAPRNKWKVISMNIAGRPARSLAPLYLSAFSRRRRRTEIAVFPRDIQKAKEYATETVMEETLHRNRSVELCSLLCRIKMPILAPSQIINIPEIPLNAPFNSVKLPMSNVVQSGMCFQVVHANPSA